MANRKVSRRENRKSRRANRLNRMTRRQNGGRGVFGRVIAPIQIVLKTAGRVANKVVNGLVELPLGVIDGAVGITRTAKKTAQGTLSGVIDYADNIAGTAANGLNAAIAAPFSRKNRANSRKNRTNSRRN